jgi:hypothetical protein
MFIVGTSAPSDQLQIDCQACATDTLVAKNTHGGPSFWSEQATKLLLSEIKSYEEKVESGRIAKKKMSMEIAANLKEHGYIYIREQVQGRYKTLTTAFKKMRDHNRKSGNDPRKCAFQEELEDIMGKKPSCSPVAACSTSATASSDEQLEETEKSEIPDESLCSQRKKKKKSASGEVLIS